MAPGSMQYLLKSSQKRKITFHVVYAPCAELKKKEQKKVRTKKKKKNSFCVSLTCHNWYLELPGFDVWEGSGTTLDNDWCYRFAWLIHCMLCLLEIFVYTWNLISVLWDFSSKKVIVYFLFKVLALLLKWFIRRSLSQTFVTVNWCDVWHFR